MSGKKLFATIMTACMVMALVACGSGSSAVEHVYLYTGGDQGTYYSLGTVIAEQITESTSTNVKVETSGGSQANIEAIDEGKADMGLVQSDVMAYAYKGMRLFANGSKVTDFSVVAALYQEQIQIVSCDGEICTVEDLRGKTVSIGTSGSGVYYCALDILEAYGMSEYDIDPVYQSFGESVDSLIDGSIDVAIVVSGAPTTAISTLAESCEVYMINLDDEHIEALIESNPYYTRSTVEEGTYGLVATVNTVAVEAVLVASDDMSEDDVYNVLTGIFDHLDTLTEAHTKASEISLAQATSITAVPYHPGAARFFAEQGISVSTK